jgi:hypothetical protein
MLFKFISDRDPLEVSPLGEQSIPGGVELIEETICKQKVVLGLEPQLHVIKQLDEASVGCQRQILDEVKIALVV